MFVFYLFTQKRQSLLNFNDVVIIKTIIILK